MPTPSATPVANPRYLAYCASHGLTPAEMLARDEVEYPGGKMAGFIAWVGKQEHAADCPRNLNIAVTEWRACNCGLES